MTPRCTGPTGYARILVFAALLGGFGVRVSAQGTSASPPAGAPPDRQSTQAPAAEHQHEDVPPASDVFLRAFGSVNFATTNEKDLPSSFALGQFALFATGAIGDRFSVLAEVVLEGSQTTEVVTDLERLQITYRLNDHLRVSAGRYHTAIGYYNTAFHHGAFFETATGRPRVFEFEDEGGVLPVHEVGITSTGSIPGTGSQLYYVAEVANGRFWGSSSDEIDEDLVDTNDAKSTNVALYLRPSRWRGLEIGTSFYRDQIPVAPDASPLDHRITTAYAVYKTPSIELMGEWIQLTHITPEGTHFTNHAGYVQLSKAFGRVRPYYRYDRQTIKPGTPLIGQNGAYDANIAGFRWDLGQWVGFKTQYEHTNETRQRGIDTLRAQLVFVF